MTLKKNYVRFNFLGKKNQDLVVYLGFEPKLTIFEFCFKNLECNKMLMLC